MNCYVFYSDKSNNIQQYGHYNETNNWQLGGLYAL
jgi:hypothetical protein